MTWEEALEAAGSAVDDLTNTGVGLIPRVALALLRASGASEITLKMLQARELDRDAANGDDPDRLLAAHSYLTR